MTPTGDAARRAADVSFTGAECRQLRGQHLRAPRERRAVPGEVPPADQRAPARREGLRAVVRREGVRLVRQDHEVVRRQRRQGRPAGSGRASRPGRCRRRAGRARRRRRCRGRAPSTAGARSARRRVRRGPVVRRAPRRRRPSSSQAGPVEPAGARASGPARRAPRAASPAPSPRRRRRPRAARRGRPRGSPRRWPARGPGAGRARRRRRGFLVPPIRATSRSAGCVHQSVAPTSRPGRGHRDRLGQRRDERDDPAARPRGSGTGRPVSSTPAVARRR